MEKREDLIWEIKSLNGAIKKKMFDSLKEKDMDRQPSPLQFKILKYLFSNNDIEVNQKKLEEELGVNKSTISETLNTMEKQGLIKRVVSTTDERVKKIETTECSKERFAEMKKTHKEVNDHITSCLSKEELEQFLNSIKRIRTYLEGENNA